MSLTSTLEASVGEGKRDDVLNQLVAAEEAAQKKDGKWDKLPAEERQALLAEHEAADASDPSPLESRRPRPRTRNRP